MKACPNCGALNGDHMEKCNSCGRPFPLGADIPETVIPAEEPVIEAPAEEPVAEPVIETPAEESAAETPVLELGTDEFVQPPEFPEDTETNKINLTLGNEEPEVVVPPVYPEAPTPEPSAPEAPTPEPETVVPPVYPEPPTPEPTPAPEEAAPNAAAGNIPPQGSAGPDTSRQTQGADGDRINLTQQAINEQRQRQQSGAYGGQTSYNRQTNYGGSTATSGNVTGTAGLVLGIIGLVLVVVFGGIGSCTGVAAYSLIFTLIGLVCSIIGLIKSSNDKKASGNTCTRANAAFLLSLIGLIIGALLLIIGLSCVGCIGCMACSAVGALVP